MLKKILRLLLLVVVVGLVACAPKERVVVLLSTNDMHAKIKNFPLLASAVEQCRDTTELVVLVDAGDRWSGNTFVDRVAKRGMPMIRLMNRLGFDVAGLGNHEFDFGQEVLKFALDSAQFDVICANLKSNTDDFPQLPPYVIVERGGIRIGFVGVVTNYEGKDRPRPAGNEPNFEGLDFPDPQQAAAEYAAELRPLCDVLVLVSHMGDDRDIELLTAALGKTYDVVLGGHTHKNIDTLINGTLLTQASKNLDSLGVTVLRFAGDKLTGVEYKRVALKDYQPDAAFEREVEVYYADPELNRTAGAFAQTARKIGLANWMVEAVADEADAQIGLYHIGGVRLDSLGAGRVTVANIYDLEPFDTPVAVMWMTPADMRRMILSKYNDKQNTKEGRRVDLISTTPYTIVVDAPSGEAVDVLFPKLREGQSYKIGVSGYVFDNYKDLNYSNGEVTDDLVNAVLFEELREESPIQINNEPLQQIVKK